MSSMVALGAERRSARRDACLLCRGALPWFNVTPIEAEHACDALNGHVCRLDEWQAGCRAESGCRWGYTPRGASCQTAATTWRYCNLLEFDFSTSLAGDQSGLLPCGSPLLAGCGADFAGLFGDASAKVHDITGNLREIVLDEPAATYRLMGGGFGTSEAGATCDFTFYAVVPTYQLYDTGFRCCFDGDPHL
jgi:hypothetical protein